MSTQDLILAGCSINSNSHILPPSQNNQIEQRIGNQTECALLDFVNVQLKEMQRVEQTYNDFKTKYKVLKTIPFNSDTKKMTVVVEVEPEKRVRVYTKGASENLIDDCAYILDTKQASGGSSHALG